jgi:hypothetical protein
MRQGFLTGICLALACSVLAGCGGGGGGDGGGGGAATAQAGASGSSQVAFTPSSIQVVQTKGQEENFKVRVTVSPEPAGEQFLALVLFDKPLVQTRLVFLTPNDDDSATISVTTEPTLEPGTYEGQMSLHICRDTQCKEEVSLTGNVLPYSIKVLPLVQLQVAGAAASGWLGNPNGYLVDPDATVVITSNIPVTWSRGSSVSGTDLQVISSTPTRWEGKILGRSGLFIGLVGSSVEKPTNNSAQVLFDIR